MADILRIINGYISTKAPHEYKGMSLDDEDLRLLSLGIGKRGLTEGDKLEIDELLRQKKGGLGPYRAVAAPAVRYDSDDSGETDYDATVNGDDDELPAAVAAPAVGYDSVSDDTLSSQSPDATLSMQSSVDSDDTLSVSEFREGEYRYRGRGRGSSAGPLSRAYREAQARQALADSEAQAARAQARTQAARDRAYREAQARQAEYIRRREALYSEARGSEALYSEARGSVEEGIPPLQEGIQPTEGIPPPPGNKGGGRKSAKSRTKSKKRYFKGRGRGNVRKTKQTKRRKPTKKRKQTKKRKS